MIAEYYNKRISKISWLKTPYENKGIHQTWWQYIVTITDDRDRTETLLKLLNEFQIPTANAYHPLCHQQEIYKNYLSENGYKNSEDFIQKIFSLPMYVELEENQLNYICECLEKI